MLKNLHLQRLKIMSDSKLLNSNIVELCAIIYLALDYMVTENKNLVKNSDSLTFPLLADIPLFQKQELIFENFSIQELEFLDNYAQQLANKIYLLYVLEGAVINLDLPDLFMNQINETFNIIYDSPLILSVLKYFGAKRNNQVERN